MSSPRLFLITPPIIEIDSFATLLDDTLRSRDVSILLFASNSINSNNMLSNYKQIQQIAHQHNISVIVHNNLNFAKESFADGVQVDELDLLVQLQAKKEPKSFEIIGATGIESKHDAMVKGETQIDYIFFGNVSAPKSEDSQPSVLQLSEWWAENFAIPGVALAGQNLESIKAVAATGIDFVAVCNAIWDFPEGPKSAISTATKILSGYKVRA